MRQKELFIISITVFLTILAWILVDIYKAKNETTVSQQFSIRKAVQYKMDPAVLQKLKNKTP